MSRKQTPTTANPCDAYEDYVTDLVEQCTTEELISAIRALPGAHADDPEEYSLEWCRRLLAQLLEYIGERLWIRPANLRAGASDWMALHPDTHPIESIARYCEVKLHERSTEQ